LGDEYAYLNINIVNCRLYGNGALFTKYCLASILILHKDLLFIPVSLPFFSLFISQISAMEYFQCL
jgi:hypothetical protein